MTSAQSASAQSFALWLEFEQYAGGYPQPDDDPDCDFCNATVRTDGRTYALNIWTFAFLEYARRFDEVSGEPKPERERFLLPPDLLVERLNRGSIEEAISALLRKGPLPMHWRVSDDE